MPDPALITLLHILVFVYWLGGDLGAFYASRFLILPGISPENRRLAAKIVGDVDMAPRSALILTLPTGVWLAEAKGWTDFGPVVVMLVWLASLAWLALAWSLHQKHGASLQVFRQADLIIRWLMIAGLLLVAFVSMMPDGLLPAFLALKCVLLAVCICLGLIIRRVLVGLGPAIAGLGTNGGEAAELALAGVLKRARPLVAAIWVVLIGAAWTGLVKPGFA